MRFVLSWLCRTIVIAVEMVDREIVDAVGRTSERLRSCRRPSRVRFTGKFLNVQDPHFALEEEESSLHSRVVFPSRLSLRAQGIREASPAHACTLETFLYLSSPPSSLLSTLFRRPPLRINHVRDELLCEPSRVYASWQPTTLQRLRGLRH